MYQQLFLLYVLILALCRSSAAVAECGGAALSGYYVALKPHGVKNDGIVGFGPDNMYDYVGAATDAWSTVNHATHKQHSATKSVDVSGTPGKIGRSTAIVAWPWDPKIVQLIGFFAETCYEWCMAMGYNHVTFLIYQSSTGPIGTYKGSITLTATKPTCETC